MYHVHATFLLSFCKARNYSPFMQFKLFDLPTKISLLNVKLCSCFTGSYDMAILPFRQI